VHWVKQKYSAAGYKTFDASLAQRESTSDNEALLRHFLPLKSSKEKYF
jgi:hypothetical protein